MNALDISYHRFGLTLREATGANARSSRRVLEGFLIRVDGGYGCVQPWPELGDGTLENQWQALRTGKPTPLLERARHCAGVDAAARREGRPLFEGLKVPHSHATVAGAADFRMLRAEGFETVKLKGARDWRPVLRQMEAAVAEGLRLRVDFNGVLRPEDFLAFVHAAADLRPWVDFVEDPVPYHAVTWERLRQATGWRLALDRTSSPGAGGFDVRVLKPALDNMNPGPGPAVITSYMDHPVGQSFAAWEAANYKGLTAGAGLMTHRLFEKNAFGERLQAAGPEWTSPGGTGLGFDDLLAELPWVPVSGEGPRMSGRVWQNPRDKLPDGGPVLEESQTGFATSGSTGLPSVVVHTAASLAASAKAVNAWLAVTAEAVWLRVLPGFHVGGYQIHTRAALSGSRVMVDDGRWEADRFVRTCRDGGVTLTSLVPAQVVDLVRAGERAPADLRAVVVGGGALPEQVVARALDLGWPLWLSYGSSEAGSQVATTQLLPLGAGRQETTFSWLEVLPHWEPRVLPDPGALVAGGPALGVLELRGPALAAGRFVWTEGHWVWSDLADRQGWWRTADKVILSGRRLRFAGRVDRVVKILGELVHLEAVEQGLEKAGMEPGRFAVVAVPEPRQGMRLVLVVEITSQPDEEAMVGRSPLPVKVSGSRGTPSGDCPGVETVMEAYGAKAAPFARISQVLGVALLPRTPLGKIRYAEVTALILPSPPG